MNPEPSEVPKTEGTAPEEAQQPVSAPPAPPRGSGGRRWLGFAVIILLAVVLGESAYILRERQKASDKSPAMTAQNERKILCWQDPMHPQYTSDKPGKAPDCGMDLVPVYADEAGKQPAAGTPEKKILYWTDAMNPGSRYDKPGKAPDGMDLVPVYAESQDQQVLPAGAFKVSAEKQQLIGVQYATAVLKPVSRSIRAVATLSYGETKVARIHPKTEGWIEQVYADFTGKLVRKGQPLLSIYSPDLVATQDEYLLALRARDKLGDSPFPDVAKGSQSLLEAARRRLQLWDVTEQQIAELERTRQPIKALVLYSPVDGFVTARNAYEKQRITPETELFSIADLSTVWAIADFYEYEIRDIKPGQAVSLSLPSFPGRTFRGRVNYIYPQVESSTRTLRVRAEFANPDFVLKPDMYANAELKVDYGRQLTIPQEAVLDSGTGQVVFVSLEGGYFEPRKIVIGDKLDDQVIVLSGLRAGEKVVTSGNFLIDSESNLKSASSGMGMPDMEEGAAPVSPRKEPMSPSPKPAKPEPHNHD